MYHSNNLSDATTLAPVLPQEQHANTPMACTSELNLFYMCFAIIGEDMKQFSSINAIIDAAIDHSLGTFLFSEYRGFKVLLQLSSFPQVQERMYPKLRDVLVGLLARSEIQDTIALKEGLTEIIRNLSRSNPNKQSIYADFSEMLFADLSCARSLRIKRFALGALNNLATLEENAVSLLRKPKFIDTILDLSLRGGTPTIRERALWTLQSLACADENEVAMARMPRVLDTLIWCVETDDTNEIKSYAIETLRNLANQNRRALVQNRRLMSGLLGVMTSKLSLPPLKDMTLSCFSRLGFSRAQVDGMHKMEILCTARDVPRLVMPGCVFHEIPNELVRRIGEALYCLPRNEVQLG